MEPYDLLADFPGWSADFDLAYRQETSRQANGVTRMKDLGAPLWSGAWSTRELFPNELDRWRAKLKLLEGGLRPFYARPSSRRFPIAHPHGSWPGGSAWNGKGTIGGVWASRNSISLAGFPAGFKVSIGDYIQIGERDLHQVMEDRTVTVAGNTSQMQIRPYLWPSVAVGAVISVISPACLMTILPGSISTSADPQTGRGTVSFRAMEAR